MGAVFVALMALVIALSSGSFKSGRRTRVENIDRYVAAGASALGKAKSRPSAMSENLVFLGERMMEGRDSTSKTMARINRADLPLRAGEWWVLRIVAAVVAVATSMVLFRGGLVRHRSPPPSVVS